MQRGFRGLAAAIAALLPLAVLAGDGPLTIEEVKVEQKTSTIGKTKGNEYIRVSFAATVKEPVGSKMTILLKGKAKMGSIVRVDDIRTGAKLDELEVGESKSLSAPLFMTEGLPADPDSLDLSFSLVRILEKKGTLLGEFCWNGRRVKPGPCDE